MARQILSRLKISGNLLATTPIHVGGNGSDPLVDLALAVNGRGKFYVPGTSLAGALRAWMTLENDQFVNQVWGFQADDRGQASFVLVEDAEIKDSKIEIRDGVGIDRLTGTAAERVKFDRAILPKGTKIPLNITVEQGSTGSFPNWDQVKAEFQALLTALQNQEVYLGAAKTRGLGRVRLEGLSIKEQGLATMAGMLATLKGNETSLKLPDLATTSSPIRQRPRLSFTIHWQPVGPVMVKAEADGIAVDMLPLVSAVGDKVSFVIPGSSIKGALRTQAERIIRTLLQLSIPDRDNPNQRFLEQLQDIPLIKSLFGNAARLEGTQQLGQIAALSIADCYAKESFSVNEWAAIETAETEKQLREKLNQAKLRDTQIAMHVAIDRWTGGAADSFLYSTLEPMGVAWQPIELGLDLSRYPKEEYEPIITLLLLLLRDLQAGRIPLGFGANRGLGAIEVTKVEISGRGLPEALEPLTKTTLEGGRIEQLSGQLLQDLTDSWQAWLGQYMELEAAS